MIERRLAAVAAEQLDHGDALVRAGRGAQGVDELDAPGDRGREPDAVVGAVDVVVHRLRDGDHRDALVVQAQPVRQRVVAADRDRARRARGARSPGSTWAVKSYGPSPSASPARNAGHVARLDPAGVRARRVEDRAAGAVDRAHRGRGRAARCWPRSRPGRRGSISSRPRPAAADADHLVAAVGDPADDRLDARVEPGNVAAAGADADPHRRSPYGGGAGARRRGS